LIKAGLINNAGTKSMEAVSLEQKNT